MKIETLGALAESNVLICPTGNLHKPVHLIPEQITPMEKEKCLIYSTYVYILVKPYNPQDKELGKRKQWMVEITSKEIQKIEKSEHTFN